VDWTGTAVRDDATRAGFEPRLRDAVLGDGFEPFRETLRDGGFAGFPFKRTDLPAEDERLEAFLVALAFDFAFVTIDAATYTSYSG
jgi:hypothetical protein